MVNDSEKLSTILPYIRALDDETKKRLEKFRQSDGNGASFAGFGYSELLDKMYELHAKYQKEKEEQCRPLVEKINLIQGEIQEQCAGEINRLVEKTIAAPRRS